MAAREKDDVTDIKSEKIATDIDATQSQNKQEQTTTEEEKLNAKSFTSALREKYCFDNYTPSGSCIIQFHSKACKDGSKAELSHLRNVDLSAIGLVCAGLPADGLESLCPNIVDLDISWNNLDTWNKILPILYQLPYLQYVNLTGNQINSHQKYLDELEKPIESIQNLVLNHTNISLEEVLKLTTILPSLKELHICNNGYSELCYIEDDTLKNIECLRANNNQLKSWSEVWKLRHLKNLKSLILSGNPLQDVFYDHQCCDNETNRYDNDSMASRNNGNNTLQDCDTSNNQGCDQNDISTQHGHSSTLQESENKTTIPKTDSLTCDATVRVSSGQPQPVPISQHKSCDTIHRPEVHNTVSHLACLRCRIIKTVSHHVLGVTTLRQCLTMSQMSCFQYCMPPCYKDGIPPCRVVNTRHFTNNIRYRHPRRIKASFPMNIYVATVTCPKCDHNRAFFMQIQTRSADEAMATFYKCCSMTCAHQWRD